MSHAQFHYLVYIFRCCHAFMNTKYGFINHRHEYAVRNKTGKIIRRYRNFAKFFGNLYHGFSYRISRFKAVDHLNKFHHRNRIEKVHADDALRLAVDRQRHRVRH